MARPSSSWKLPLVVLAVVAALSAGLGSLVALAAFVYGCFGPGKRWLRMRTDRKRILNL